MGTILKEGYHFDSLADARKAYSDAFAKDNLKILAAINDPSLDALSAVRNVIVHNGGIADQRFAEKKSYLPASVARSVGEPILLDGEIVASLVEPVMRAAADLVVAADEWITAHTS
jgi:hypothetical protein